jgi:AraC-like DNA-binding protein
MKNSFNLFAAVDLLGVAQALLLASVLLSVKRGNRTANRLLAAFVIVIAISVGGATMATDHFILLYPHLLKIQDPFYFLGAPLLFLYVRTLIIGRSGSKKDLLHFLPSGLCLVYLTPFYFQSSAAKLFSIRSYFYFWQRWSYVRSATLILQFIIYLSLVAWMLGAYTRRLKRRISSADEPVLFQVRFLLASLTVLWVIGALKFVLTTINPAYDYYAAIDLLVPASLSVFVYAMGYIALRKPEVVTGMEGLPPPAKRYEKSTLTLDRADAYLKRLLDLMEKEKPYTDGDLTLQKLAKTLAISPHHLSQMINEQLNQNFFEFINLYRIEEAKRMLVDPNRKHYSILAISEEVGFNSKSAFNAAFKKHTHMTPSEFRTVTTPTASREIHHSGL